ncbi:conserved domain protein [delta proteobacterium NaphS2]|nr:conserved domain protein [delta proteobacterium NaphS2]
MKVLFIITTDDGETIFNAMRLANVGVNKGDEVSVFMLGKGVTFETSGSEEFDVMGQMNKFEGDFYV